MGLFDMNSWWDTDYSAPADSSNGNYQGTDYSDYNFTSGFGDVESEGASPTTTSGTYTAPTMWDNVSGAASTAGNTLGGWLSNPQNSVTSGEKGGLSPSNLFKGGLGLYDYMQKRQALKGAEDTYNQYNSQARNYANQLADLQANPDSFKTNPAYVAANKAAIDRARRTAAATGNINSSGYTNRLNDAANTTAMQWYNQEANRLQQLSALNNTAANSAAALKGAKTDQMTGAYAQYAKMFGLI